MDLSSLIGPSMPGTGHRIIYYAEGLHRRQLTNLGTLAKDTEAYVTKRVRWYLVQE